VIRGDENRSESFGNIASFGETVDSETTPEQPHQVQRESRQRKLPGSMVDFEIFPDNVVTDEGDLVHFALLAKAEPVNHQEALGQELWRKAMMEELQAIEKSQTWFLTELPVNKKPVDVKWVFKLKLNPDGTISKRKARLVARSFL